MSNYSSEEELGDSLQIKPPQLKPRHRTDRPHSRRGREEPYQSNRNPIPYRREYEDPGPYDGPRRREYDNPLRRGDEGFVRSSRHPQDIGPDRSSFRRRPHDRLDRRDVAETRLERPVQTSRYRSDSPPSSSKDDSRQLQKHKKKRKHAEEEEERAFREIERRRERERRKEEGRSGTNDESGSSGSRKRSKLSREKRSPPKPHSRGSQSDNEEEMLDLTVSDEDVRNLLPSIEPDVESHSDEEGQVAHNSDESDDEQPRKRQEDKSSNGASDISSESERKQSRSESSKNDSSEDSESDSSGSEEAKQKKDSTNGKLTKSPKHGRESRAESDISDESMGHTPPDDGDEAIPLVKDTIDLTHEEKPKTEKVERELTEVEKACQELDLLPPYYPSIQGCRRVEEFQLLNRIEEGTYGVVYRAKDKRTNEVVALKRLKMEKEKDGFPITSLREINTLLKSQHENIVTVREIVVGSNTDKIFLVMDYVEHDLKSLMETLKQKKQEFIMGEVKCLLIQLLRAVAHMHDNWILHRDLKTSNLLLSHKGILKVGDFGLAREYGSPLKSYTPIVVTLWYRAPELLLGAKEYSTPIDVWSVGCIFGELLKMEPMFPGKSEANQLNLIFQTLGTPNDKIWHGYSKMPLLQKMTFGEYPVNKLKTKFGILSDTGVDLMNKFLTYNPAKRITAEEALNHSFFREAPLPIDPSIFPTWPAKSEMGIRKHASPKPPSGGRQFKDLKEDDSVGFFLGAGDRRPPMGAGFSLKF